MDDQRMEAGVKVERDGLGGVGRGSGFVLALIVACFLSLALQTSTASAETDLRVVLVGDSYAAGNGAGSYWGPKGCYRSHRNWAERYLDTLRDDYSVDFTNRACSGNLIADVRRSGRLEAQWNAIDESTDLVLLSIGGNDLGFSKIVRKCFAVAIRSALGCRDRVAYANGQIGTVESNTVELLRGLKRRMDPEAKIIFNSYPYLEKDPHLTLGHKAFGIGFVYDVGEQVRDLGDRGEQAQSAAVSLVNREFGAEVIYMDQIKALFAGHEPDGRVRYRNPARWIHEFDTTTSNEWYHYNWRGHIAIAKLLAAYGSFGTAAP